MYAGSQFIGAAEEDVAYGGKGRDRCILHALELRSWVVHAGLFRCRVPIAFEKAVFIKVGEGIIVNVDVKVGTIGKALGIAGKPAAELGIVVSAAEGIMPFGCEEPGGYLWSCCKNQSVPQRGCSDKLRKDLQCREF